MLLRLNISQCVEEVEVAPVPQHLVRHQFAKPHEDVACYRGERRLEVLDAADGVLDLVAHDETMRPAGAGPRSRPASVGGGPRNSSLRQWSKAHVSP